MILHRIATRLKDQHWTAVFSELAILVLGVFLGIQATEWAERRASRAAEIRHLEEIAEDLRDDIAEFDGIQQAARSRISGIDYLLGESRGVNRPSGLVTPTGEVYDMPAGPGITAADRMLLLGRANLIRSTSGNRTGFEALLGAGDMLKIRDRRISRQLQVYYAKFDELDEMTSTLKQFRATGVAQGYALGLSAFGEMDPDKLIAIVRGSPAYSAYLRTNREWAAIYLGTIDRQRQRGLALLADIERYLGEGGS